jgi:hypothetical protein
MKTFTKFALPTTHQSIPPYTLSLGRFVETVLWVMFISQILNSLVYSGGEKSALYFYTYYTTQIGGIILILLSSRYLVFLPSYERLNRGFWLLRPMIFIIFYASVVGLILGIVPRDFIYLCLLPFGSSLLILLPAHHEIKKRLIRIFSLQIVMAICLGIYGIVNSHLESISIASRDIWYQSPEAMAANSLFAVPLLIAGFGKIRMWQVAAALGAYVLYIYMSFRGLNRASIVVYCLILPAALLAVMLKGRGLTGKILLLSKGVAVLVLILLTISLLSNVSLLWHDNAVNQMLFRFTSSREWLGLSEMSNRTFQRFSSEVQDIRGAEIKDFLSFIEPWVYVVGRGFGTTWYSRYWGTDWDIVHSGPFYLIFRGGIPLLITYLLLVLGAWRRSWLNATHDWVARGCFAYLTCRLFSFIFYGAYVSEYTYFAFWLIVGMAMSSSPYSRRNESPEYSISSPDKLGPVSEST